jgi:hypothetical protein
MNVTDVKQDTLVEGLSSDDKGEGKQHAPLSGWVVEVVMTISCRSSESRFFAVQALSAKQAIEAVLIYPGIERSDQRFANRSLSAAEISLFELRPGAVHPYGGRAARSAVQEKVEMGVAQIPTWPNA